MFELESVPGTNSEIPPTTNDTIINETIDPSVNAKLLSLLTPELSSKLLNLLIQESNSDFERTLSLLTPELNPDFTLEIDIPSSVEPVPTVEPVNNLITFESAIQTRIDAAVQSALQSLVQPTTQSSIVQPTVYVSEVIEEKPTKPEIDLYFESHNITNLEGHTQLEPKLTEFLSKLVTRNKIKTVLEIGFNAGHSADTFLKSNKNIKLTSFDIGTHAYVNLGKKYIDTKYPNRHTLVKGDSRVAIPNYSQKNPEMKFDVIFIDGGHFENVPEMDLKNCRSLAHKNTIVILNDVKNKNVKPWNVKPNEAWNSFIKSNYIEEIKRVEFSSKNGIVYGKYNLCEVYVCTLLRPDRVKYIEQNKKLFPFIKIFKSVNGYNINQTLNEMNTLQLKYKDLDENFKTYGTLACWLTKYKMLKHQVDNKIPYLCFIEDDLILDKNFYSYVNDTLIHFKKNVNILRMMTWGEGYITSFESAKRLLAHLSRDGIIRNIDNQLRENCGNEVALENPPMKLMMKGGNGDCGKTKDLANAKMQESKQKK